jgi:xanthosine utilization system XapX-like protein
MSWLAAPDYWIGRLLIERAVAGVYLIAFLIALDQFVPLLGERGLLPVPRFLRLASFREAPSLFHWRYSDRLLRAVAGLGAALAAGTVLGLTDLLPAGAGIAVWLLIWALYLSIVNVGQTFYAFGWESLLLETGFLVAFLGPVRAAPPAVVLWLLRWLLFRVELGAGLIKLRGDPCWRDLTCLCYHHETQPMPNPLSRAFHHLPRPLHRAEVLGNHLAQLVVPFFLFAPQPLASLAGIVILATQGWLVLSGNFAWLNLLTMTLALAGIDDGFIHRLLPIHVPPPAPLPPAQAVLSLLLGVVVGALSWAPARNLVSRRQLMNFSYNPLHLVNSYGAFGSVTRRRYEIVIEGNEHPLGEARWREYEFRGKPGDVRRRPPQVAPWHLRLDWLMWFAAMSPPAAHPWLAQLLVRLLRGDPATLRLLRRNPFPERPPAVIRARLWRYRFSTSEERRASGAWWVRELVGDHLPESRLAGAAGTAPAPSPVG